MSDSIQLEIQRPGKEPSIYEIEPGIYSVGKDDDCKISLSHDDVEGRHAIITIRDGLCWIEDLDARTGTYLDGKKIESRVAVKSGQRIGIGPFALVITMGENVPESAPQPVPAIPEPGDIPIKPPAPFVPTQLVGPELEQKRSIKQQIHRELVERMDIKRLTASRISREELRNKVLSTIRNIVGEVSSRLPPGITPDTLAKEIYEEAVGLGPIEDFLADPEVTEVMVNGHNQIYVEKKGKLVLTEKTFMDDTSVLAIIERIVSPLGRRIDESQPYVDARLPDGSRVNAIIHPLSLVGPCLTIRKFSKIPFTDQDMIRFGTMTPFIAQFMQACILLRKNIIVSGGTGSGKTTLLNVLSSYLPESERIVTIEDAAELRLKQRHVVRLEARPPNIEGKGAITIRDLVRNALRMRPDRIVIGECRGGEALDMLQAMNTGHDGSLTTIHANTPRDVVSRLETMVLMSGMDLPVRAIREQVAAAIDVIVHEARLSDGSRKITHITEIVGLEGDQITMQDIFEYEQTGVDKDGKVVGNFRPTGSVPTFIENLSARGMTINRSMFDPMQWKEDESKKTALHRGMIG
jgi:pilus assembly protein CpaF